MPGAGALGRRAGAAGALIAGLAAPTGVAGAEALCGKECMDRAASAQMLIVGLLLVVILAAGLCCAVSLDSPDRFEVPKDRRE